MSTTVRAASSGASFTFFTQPLGQDAAAAACNALGMQLAAYTSTEEQAEVIEQLNTSSEYGA